jgi:D-alanine-D-alanine ligase
MKVILLYGGKSGEHEVSLVSASAIVRNIDKGKHEVTLVGITKAGEWFLQDRSEIDRVLAGAGAALRIAQGPPIAAAPGRGLFRLDTCRPLDADIAFPALHGAFGEDGCVQGLLETAEVPYAGSGVMASALCMDKEKAKQVWQLKGLPVVPWVCLKEPVSGSALEECEKRFGYPLFVKPCSAGSSVGAGKAQTRPALEAAVREAFLWDEKVLVEPALQAREIECSVTGNPAQGKFPVTAYSPGEVAPTHEFYDYDAKYTDPRGADLQVPAKISPKDEAFIKETAAGAYEALGCAGLSRVDFFLDKKSGKIFLNEINTMPGFTPISMFPRMCAASGLAFPALIDLLLEEGLERYTATRAKQTEYVDLLEK